MGLFELLTASLHHPLAGARCDRKGAGKPTRLAPAHRGWFPPPRDTLALGVGRQPNGYTCGTESFVGICEFLRLPVDDPDDNVVEDYSKLLQTSARYGTDPEDLVATARGFLKIGARLENHCSVERLRALTNQTQTYVDALLRGARITRPLTVAMVTYQAYIDKDHQKSWFFPRGRRTKRDRRHRQLLQVRDKGRILWENDWTDGHWSVVLRVVSPGDRELAPIIRRIGPAARDGVVILGDPSNGEALSYVPIPEFERRWHDTDRYDTPRFRQTAVVFTVSKRKLEQMRRACDERGVPMFSTTRRNAVIYLP